jgi:hypothetical protein
MVENWHYFNTDCDMCDGGEFREDLNQSYEAGVAVSECVNCWWSIVTYGSNAELYVGGR